MASQEQKYVPSRWKLRHRWMGHSLAHPAAPSELDGLWKVVCKRPDCMQEFVTRSKQRRYCSPRCRRLVEQQRARIVDYRRKQLLGLCAAADCLAPFIPTRRQHIYCSRACGQRARRAATHFAFLNCAECGQPLGSRTARARFCDPACRMRAARKRSKRVNLRP